MVVHHKRRRRKPEKAEVAAPKRRTRPAARKLASPKTKLRPVYRIALSLFETYSKFGGHKHKVYKQFRILFCITTAEDKYNEWDEKHLLVKAWSGREAIEQWLEGSKSVRNKQVQLYREELAAHLEA